MIRKIILNWQTLCFRWHHWLKTQYEHLQACWPGGHFRPQRWHLHPEQQQEEGADRGRAEAELETRRALLLPEAGGREVAEPGQTVGGRWRRVAGVRPVIANVRYHNQFGHQPRRQTKSSWKCPDIHYQFELFAKFGDSGWTVSSLVKLVTWLEAGCV